KPSGRSAHAQQDTVKSAYGSRAQYSQGIFSEPDVQWTEVIQSNVTVLALFGQGYFRAKGETGDPNAPRHRRQARARGWLCRKPGTDGWSAPHPGFPPRFSPVCPRFLPAVFPGFSAVFLDVLALYSRYKICAITLSAAPISGAAWEGDNTPELSKSFTSLMKELRFPIAPAFFPAFIRFIAC